MGLHIRWALSSERDAFERHVADWLCSGYGCGRLLRALDYNQFCQTRNLDAARWRACTVVEEVELLGRLVVVKLIRRI